MEVSGDLWYSDVNQIESSYRHNGLELIVMYEIINNPKIMTKAEIDKTYNGKWVYIVKADINKHGTLITGMPVVIGDYQFEGVDEDRSIYDKYDSKEFEKRLSYPLYSLENFVSVYTMEWN